MNELILPTLICRGTALEFCDIPLLMGIINVTPDSFSDGGDFLDVGAAIAQGLSLVDEGARLLDVGGESTRPGAAAVSAEEQIRRVVPVIEGLARQSTVPISIDTTRSEVARAALGAGASIINDISALRFDADIAGLAAREKAPIILMHMQGKPRTMQKNPHYEDVVGEVKAFLGERIEYAVAAGIERCQIVIDPGIGFGKTLEHNLLLLRHIEAFFELGAAVLVGPSRKSFIGKILHLENPRDRVWGTAGVVVWCGLQQVPILRVHEVKEMKQILDIIKAIRD